MMRALADAPGLFSLRSSLFEVAGWAASIILITQKVTSFTAATCNHA
ncbi:hypothetical protein SAMN04487976_105299 [Xaviernesmea oryzae]|nr:hypothetical protein SAMN04487976_105299 [Xaviernesmea oryzae]